MIDSKIITLTTQKATIIEKILSGDDCLNDVMQYFNEANITSLVDKLDELFNIIFTVIKDSKPVDELDDNYKIFISNLFEAIASSDRKDYADFYSGFIFSYIIYINNNELAIVDKIKHIQDLNYETIPNSSQAKKLYLNTFLTLLINTTPINTTLLNKVNNELKDILAKY